MDHNDFRIFDTRPNEDVVLKRRRLICELVFHAAQKRRLFFFSSRRLHTSCSRDWSSDVCSSDIAFDAVILSGLFGIASYLIAPRILTSIEGEPLLIEDLLGRREELQKELAEFTKQSEGWLREEIEERVVKDFLTVSFLLRQIIKREPLTTL